MSKIMYKNKQILGCVSDAQYLSYNNSNTGLSSTNVQSAITEVNSKLSNINNAIYIQDNFDDYITQNANKSLIFFGHSEKLSNIIGYWCNVLCFGIEGYYGQLAIGTNGLRATRFYFGAEGYGWTDWQVNNQSIDKTNSVDIVLSNATNADSIVKIIGNIANLTLCVSLPSVSKGTTYNLGTCNTYSNHYVRHTGSLTVGDNLIGQAFITVQPSGIIQFSSSVDYSGNIILNDDIMFITF